nr:MAG: hypothetical protein [Bacteriophage sp.]
MNLTLKVKDVQFVNHNNRTAARSYIDLCNKLSKAFRDKYTDKHYIKDNWFTDKFIINDSKSNKEVLEHFIDELNELSDSIKAKV